MKEPTATGEDYREYLDLVRTRPRLFDNPPGAGFVILLTEPEMRDAERQARKKLEDQDLPAEWARVGIAFQDQYMLILRDAVRFPDGTLGTYIRTVPPDQGAPGVVVLPLHEGDVLLVNHFRHATRTWHLELPRGFGHPGLTPEESARAELQEEIGATASRIEELGRVYPDSGADAGGVMLFLAYVSSHGEVDRQEAITELVRVPVVKLEQLISNNTITDGFTIAAYTRAKLRRLL